MQRRKMPRRVYGWRAAGRGSQGFCTKERISFNDTVPPPPPPPPQRAPTTKRWPFVPAAGARLFAAVGNPPPSQGAQRGDGLRCEDAFRTGGRLWHGRLRSSSKTNPGAVGLGFAAKPGQAAPQRSARGLKSGPPQQAGLCARTR